MVAPGLRAGRGLKRLRPSILVWWIGVAPGLRAGRGLKQHPRCRDGQGLRVAPGLRAGRGLKPAICQVGKAFS